jgi:transcriptional regulator of acetoin/glycerol metabolism
MIADDDTRYKVNGLNTSTTSPSLKREEKVDQRHRTNQSQRDDKVTTLRQMATMSMWVNNVRSFLEWTRQRRRTCSSRMTKVTNCSIRLAGEPVTGRLDLVRPMTNNETTYNNDDDDDD